MKDLPEQQGAPAVVLYQEENDNGVPGYSSFYQRIKVLTEAGRRYADVQIPYYTEDLQIEDLHGRTIHVDGSIVEFQGKPIDKNYVKSKTVTVKMKIVSLPDVQKGSVLELRYNVHHRDANYYLPPAPHWLLQDELFQRKAHFTFTAPPTKLLVAYTSFLPQGVEVRKTHDRYDLNFSNMPAFVEEEHMPPSQPFKYQVRFFYSQVANQDEFWSLGGKGWSQDVDHFVGKKGGVADALATIVAPSDTPDQKVKKIYDYVARIDNLSYHPQRTEQEEKVLHLRENKVAADVLRQQYGYRNEITLLFVALVRAAGIPAWVMAVADRSDTIFDRMYLNPEQFGAEIAIVRLDDKDVFLDPGTKFCPYGLVNWKHSATQGIRQTANGGTEIAETPVPDYTMALTKRVARFHMNDQGQAEGSMAVGYFGQEALVRRLQGMQSDDAGRTKSLEDEVKSWFPPEAQVSLTKSPDWNTADTPLIAEFKVTSPMLNSAGKRVLLPANPLEYNRPAMLLHNERVYPVYVEFPSRVLDDVRITLPDNLQVEGLPASVSAQLDYALYKADRKQEKNVVISSRDLIIANFALKTSEYKAIKGFYDKVKEYDDQQVLLKRATNAAH